MATTKQAKQTWSDKYLANRPDFFTGYGGQAVVDGDALLLVIRGVTLQRVTREDDQSVREEFLLTAAALAELEGKAGHYTAGVLPGFVSIKFGRDPRPSLEANVGAATGAAIFEVKNGGATAAQGAAARVASFLASSPARATAAVAVPPPLVSAGGAYVAMARSAAGTWKEGAWQTLLRGVDDGASVIALPSGEQALALGDPSPLHARAGGKDALLIRVISSDAADDALLEKQFAAIKSKGLMKLAEPLTVAGPWVVFDSALSGKDALASDDSHRVLELEPGRWEVATKTESPDEGTELLVVRLRRSR